MTTENLALFKAIGAKMDFLTQRQRVIAQNVSNADTPNYRPQDIRDSDFSKVLQNITQETSGVERVSLGSTSAGHFGAGSEVEVEDPRKQRETYEVAPIGNAVIMEEQLLMSGRTVMDYNLMTNLLQKNVGMIRTAIGRQQ